MKVKNSDLFTVFSGSLSETHYVSPIKNEPGFSIIRRKPGPRKPKDGSATWTMPENQARYVEAFKGNLASAKRAYHDPEVRPLLQHEYDLWLKDQKRHGKLPYLYHGKHVRHFWDYVRIRVAIENPYR